MRAILILYLTAKTSEVNAGLGWDKVSALELYGWYTMMVYVMSVPGGLLADRWLGQKKTVMLGGFLLCIGHFILAFDALWAFYTGIVFIVFGVGAFAAPLLVGYVGEVINWHYGFGLAGIGMALGQIVYIWGQKYLTTVGNFVPVQRESGTNKSIPLTSVEKDRMIVLILSFIIVIVFWGAYEQAGGLMNLYARDKINRVMFGFTVPSSFLQALPAFYVILFGMPIAYFWTMWVKKGKESSSLFKMGIGTIITGFGFLLLAGAAIETASSLDGKAAIYWLFGAYLLHVIGELSVSPVALSFITKLAPLKYASLMMGAYFMVTGIGNKLAGYIGEAAQNAGEYAIFMGVFIFCVSFGLLLVVFVKKLKKLTHGADDIDPKVVIIEAE
jgi:POT family proton-dependent oligopeptide transporter